MRVRGEDTLSSPTTPGMRPNEIAVFRVNGWPAVTNSLAVPWTNSPDPIQINLAASTALPVASVLAAIDGKYDYVLDEFGTYAPPPALQHLNTLARLSPGKGYFIRMRQAADLVLSGQRLPDSTPIQLAPGWHWIGYLPAAPRDLPAALAAIAGSYDYLLGEGGTYAVSPPYPGANSLARMEPGRGYLIRMTAPANLIYGSGAPANGTVTATAAVAPTGTTTATPTAVPSPTATPTGTSLPVGGLPDLAVSVRSSSPSQGCGLQPPWHVEVTVQNLGSAAAGAFRVAVVEDWGTPAETASWNVPVLAAGGSQLLSADLSRGMHSLVDIADVDGQVAESDEGNNQTTAMLPAMTAEPSYTPTVTATASATPTATLTDAGATATPALTLTPTVPAQTTSTGTPTMPPSPIP